MITFKGSLLSGGRCSLLSRRRYFRGIVNFGGSLLVVFEGSLLSHEESLLSRDRYFRGVVAGYFRGVVTFEGSLLTGVVI